MNIDFQNRSKRKFCEILAYFSAAEYAQKVDFMKKEWGNIVETSIIKYEDCSIEIGIENNKYYFQFNCENFTLEDLLDTVPSYAEDILNLEKKELLAKYSELLDINYIKEEENNIGQEQEISEDNENNITVESNYLNIYKGINISKK